MLMVQSTEEMASELHSPEGCLRQELSGWVAVWTEMDRTFGPLAVEVANAERKRNQMWT